MSDGSKGSIFDALEDMNAGDCLAKMVELNGLNGRRDLNKSVCVRVEGIIQPESPKAHELVVIRISSLLERTN
jgi:hypothetical protein